MGNISISEAQGLYTKGVVAIYKEMVQPASFLSSMFTKIESNTKEVSIEVSRGTEKIAVDVERGSKGNLNKFSKSTEKLIVPPTYREFFLHTDLDFYDQLFPSSLGGTINTSQFDNWMNQLAEKYNIITNKIKRAEELQASQVFEDGIIQLQASTNIDFRRKAGSKVDLTASNYWIDANVDPRTSIAAGCKFIRQEGKSMGNVYNLVMGETAITHLFTKISAMNLDVRNVDAGNISAPIRNSVGATSHGYLNCGDYIVYLWSYPEFYENSAGTKIPYLNAKKAFIVPMQTNFIAAYGALPTLISTNDQAIPSRFATVQGQYILGNRIDVANEHHIFDVKSAPVYVPVAVDTIYTMQVVA